MAKVKGIENWTDVDYAQAAIDMLPGSVEEIWVFLEAQGIKNVRARDDSRTSNCPIAQWVHRWAGSNYVGAAWDEVFVGENAGAAELVPLPKPIDDFIFEADSNIFP